MKDGSVFDHETTNIRLILTGRCNSKTYHCILHFWTVHLKRLKAILGRFWSANHYNCDRLFWWTKNTFPVCGTYHFNRTMVHLLDQGHENSLTFESFVKQLSEMNSKELFHFCIFYIIMKVWKFEIALSIMFMLFGLVKSILLLKEPSKYFFSHG